MAKQVPDYRNPGPFGPDYGTPPPDVRCLIDIGRLVPMIDGRLRISRLEADTPVGGHPGSLVAFNVEPAEPDEDREDAPDTCCFYLNRHQAGEVVMRIFSAGVVSLSRDDAQRLTECLLASFVNAKNEDDEDDDDGEEF